jgi:hypothetical protein
VPYAAGIAHLVEQLGYGRDDPDFEFMQGKEIFFSKTKKSPDSVWGTIQWVQGLFPRVKHPRREAKQSPPFNGEVKNKCNYTATPPIRFYGLYTDNYTFLPLTLCHHGNSDKGSTINCRNTAGQIRIKVNLKQTYPCELQGRLWVMEQYLFPYLPSNTKLQKTDNVKDCMV